ncbi:MAG TPA: hypothetical protein VIN09_10780, partial [Chloroflexota bacterium]
MITTWGRTVGYYEQNAPQIASPEVFRVMQYKPVGPHNPKRPSDGTFTMLDGEQWVVYKSSKNPQVAMEFLRFFYERENYLEYVNSVPIHLLPIDARLFKDPQYTDHPVRKKWKPWLDYQETQLSKRFT